MSNIVVHAHFYQPPREDPWTGRIEHQPSAGPFHDWNERVHAECYRPNAFARIPTQGGEETVNNYERLSFNVGPTLLSWMETADPETYGRILEADRASAERLGHGNAIAQAFHHTILPLSNRRDIQTEVRWGLADFRYRFGREPEGMWLPETAANNETLSVLIEEGVRFTILAPRQIGRWREPGGAWVNAADVPVDGRVAHRYFHRDESGRFLNLLVYDGDISQAIAFEKAGTSAEHFIDLFARRAGDPSHVVHAATDGETYGHHHPFTELGLAFALFVEAERRGLTILNHATYLDRFPGEREGRLVRGQGTSWSCVHGVRRWYDNCGCSTGGQPGWTQQWRTPLRRGLELVRDAVDDVYEKVGAGLFRDPWGTRDRYVEVVIGQTSLAEFLGAEALDPLNDDDRRRAGDLLEMEQNSLAMFTSCGWFFNDISGIETVQVLRYAARALELLETIDGASPRDEFLAVLAQARSNDADAGTGADIFRAIHPAR